MGHRILVVEDHADTRDLLCEWMVHHGYMVATAIDGLDALDKFVPGQYACVITDHYMPRMSGLDMIARLRAMEPTLPIILLTGASEVIKRPMRGIITLVKPTALDLLVAVVKELAR